MSYFSLFFVVLYALAVRGHTIYSRQASLITGDTQCTSLMCIAATVNGSSTTYVLSSLGNQKLGWMAMGFGDTMANSPMVIMWINGDGSVTLSQRSAAGEFMPTVSSNPPRVAVKALDLSVTSSTTPHLAFIIPTNGDTSQQIIWGYGTTQPSSSAADANLVQHLDSGTLTLNLSKQLSSGTAGTTPSSLPTSGSSNSGSIPLAPYQKLIIAHGIVCTIGFLLLLPIGVFWARYLRTFYPKWFKGHWIAQFGLAGPAIFIGVILGISAVGMAKAQHLDDDHKRWGIAIFVLYFVQCGLGAFIHFVKKASRTSRPPQNYLHAVFGLIIIGLAMNQVHSGYNDEWPMATGRNPVPGGINIFFWIWVAVLILSYVGGLSFLPKQYRQERAKGNDNINLKETEYLNVDNEPR